MAAATVTGPIRERQVNDTFYVTAGAFTTIQKAIDYLRIFNGGAGRVIAPVGCPDSTAISALTGGSAGSMYVTDQRSGTDQNWTWDGPNNKFIPTPDIQQGGFIASGSVDPAFTTTASTSVNFDPAASFGHGGGSFVVEANDGQGMPGLTLVGQPGDGTGAHTFLLADQDASGDPQVQMPQILNLNNGGVNINLWTGSDAHGVPGAKGMSVFSDAANNRIDLQGETAPGTFDQTIRLNPGGGQTQIANLDATALHAATGNFDVGNVAGSQIRTFENTPVLAITNPAMLIDNRSLVGTGIVTPPSAGFNFALGSTKVAGSTTAVTLGRTNIYIGPDPWNPGLTVDAYPLQFQAIFFQADATRIVRLYLLTPDGSGGYTPFYASPDLAFPGAGTLSYTVPNGANIFCAAGTVIAIAMTSVNGGNAGIYTANFGATAKSLVLRGPADHLDIGVKVSAATSGYSTTTSLIPKLSCFFNRAGALVPQRSADLAYGYAKLDSTGSVKPAALASSLALASDSYATAPTVTKQQIGFITQNGSGTNGTFIMTSNPTTIAGVLRGLSLICTAPGNVEYYLFTPNGDGTFTLRYASGPQPVVAGSNTYTLPNPLAVRAPVGSVIGLATDGTSTINFVNPAPSLRLNIAILGNLGIDKIYGLNRDADGVLDIDNSARFTANAVAPAMSAIITTDAILVPTSWADKGGGFVSIQPNGTAAMKAMPKALGGGLPVSVANGAIETSFFDVGSMLPTRKVAYDRSYVPYQMVSPLGTNDPSGSALNNIIIGSWLNTGTAGSGGFVKGGNLVKVRVPPITLTVAAGQKLQCWVARPNTPLPSDGTGIAVSLVAPVGEVTRLNTTDYLMFECDVAVQAGDILLFRGINMGVYFGAGSSDYLNDYQGGTGAGQITDMTLDALNNGITLGPTAHRRIDVFAEVQPGPYATHNTVNSSTGDQARTRFRSEDQPWYNKVVLALGTSITASNPVSGGGAGSILTGSGYIAQSFRALVSNGINNGVGSSGICWDPTNISGGKRALSLSATRAELTANGFDPNQSYETKMLGLFADLVVFDHGYNDRGYTIGNLLQGDNITPNMDRSQFYGAYNYLIAALKADRPAARFIFITPISVYNPSTGQGTVPAGGWANTLAIRTAMLALAAYYNVPILDWTYDFELNHGGIQPNAVPSGGPPPNFRGAWDPTVTYALNDSVVYLPDGRTYIGLAGSNTNNIPTYLPGAGTWWRAAGHTLDGVHPDQGVHDRAARELYRFLLKA